MTKKEKKEPKKKNPARVAAGKKAWRNMSPAKKARAKARLRGHSRGKSHKPKHHKSQSKKSSPCRKRRRGLIFG